MRANIFAELIQFNQSISSVYLSIYLSISDFLFSLDAPILRSKSFVL
jgi:hypothetical protein